MDLIRLRRRAGRHALPVAAATAGLATLVLLGAVAAGVPGNGKPEMQVLPSPTGLDYGQTVRVKGDDLPEGSGLIAATICGLTDAAGKPIPEPTADDCAGANELGRGLVVLQENTDGTYDQPYTLPQSGEKFGVNERFCDKTHHCALVLADANPDDPAYYIPQVLQFKDQQPFGGGGLGGGSSTTTTTRKPDPTATASAEEVTVGDSVDVTGEHWAEDDGDTVAGFVDGDGNPTTPPVAATVDDSGTLTVTLTAEFDDIDATAILVRDPTSDPATHSVTIPIDVHPEPGVSGKTSSDMHLGEDPHLQLRARIVLTPPPSDGGGEGGGPLPPEVAEPVDEACRQLVDGLSQATGSDASALMTACQSITQGGGGDQLQLLLQQPSVLCLALAPAVDNNPDFVDACNQALGSEGAAQVTKPVGEGVKPLTDQMP
jgi:hypothetical protein